MKSKSLIVAAGFASLLVLADIASAHPGHGASGFAAGVRHPLSGIDHILAMIAAGLCAAQMGGRALWMLPVTFIAFMIGGGILGLGHAPAPMIEQAIAATVLVLGLIVASGSPLAMPVTTGLVALFALFHGYAHGAEMRAGIGPMQYAAGFVVATAILNGVGLVLGSALKRGRWPAISRLAGGVIAVCGAVLIWS